jgi:hypothetical protein
MATEIGNEGYLELGEMDGVWVRFTQDGLGIDGGCRGQKTEEKSIQLQQRSWDTGTEATSSTEVAAIEYDRWAYGTNVKLFV